MSPGERSLLESLDALVRSDPVRARINLLIERATRKLAQDPAASMAWETIPLDVYGAPLPASIQSSWVFILRAGATTGAERHPNSHQRMMSYHGTGDLQTGGAGQWQSHALVSQESAALEERWISVPPNVWHQAVVPGEDWVVVSFHTAPAEKLIEERPDAVDAGRTERRTYLSPDAKTDEESQASSGTVAASMFTLSHVVPLGRSFDEYRRMFALSDFDLRRSILGCADGPASFNAEATQRGSRVVSCDPLYRCSGDEIRRRIEATFPDVMEQARRNAAQFVWSDIPSLEELERCRRDAMQAFLADYDKGRRQGRYVEAELPSLPFADGSFDLALCSHFLFLYTEQLSQSFHVQAIIEMCRVAAEVRVFPLVALDGRPSRHADPVAAHLKEHGLGVSVGRVPYEFQRGGNQMLRIRAKGGPAA